ncbi:3-hydroxyacyl-CoA dehydrogenase NAD-binding domain-containing protein [Desulfocicer vacuolatum]|nr:3-hydroxyacyl-CoA dehydrogenase NAD-binding domain-containing protein [Desulfocicer vacuolatum]
MNGFTFEKDAEKIVTITMDMAGPVNAMNDEFLQLMHETMEQLEKEKEDIAGVIITSGKKTFFAGGDLNKLLSFQKGEEEAIFNFIEKNKSYLRRLELLGCPVVAAVNGAALGGGCEIALACHHRVVIDDSAIRIGMPEVTLGLLPGAGGVVRTVRMVGLEKALPILMEGKKMAPGKAMSLGLVDELAADADEMMKKARAWIKDNPQAKQPWDIKGYRIPGGDANKPNIVQILQMAPGMLYQKTRGNMPAPEGILAVAAESLRVDFDTALRIESRKLTHLVLTPVAKNLITTFFFQMNALNAGGSRPRGVEKSKVSKIGVLGAGMMGQGLAYVSAMAGIEVVLKDISMAAAEKGKAYSDKLLSKAIKRGKMDAAGKQVILDRITPSVEDHDLDGCDLIIEAVFENMELKHKVIRATEPYLVQGGIYASNTSTLPITELAGASEKAENFIGLHFFSPVDKMPLVEIITGKNTSDETLARGFDFTQQIRKIPIVVNDARGFFTSRVFGTFIDEGCRMVKEGVDPVLVDAMGRQVGMPVGPLTVHDEVAQELTLKVSETNQELDQTLHGNFCAINPIMDEMSRLLVKEYKRGGRIHGGGWYDYHDNGEKEIWPRLYDLFHKPDVKLPRQDMLDRLLFRQSIESIRCYEEGVFNAVQDGNIGSIMGIGFPPYTGGVLQYINTYGVKEFASRAMVLAEKYGERFTPPTLLMEKAEKGLLFQ